jgi:hypothetical protein
LLANVSRGIAGVAAETVRVDLAFNANAIVHAANRGLARAIGVVGAGALLADLKRAVADRADLAVNIFHALDADTYRNVANWRIAGAIGIAQALLACIVARAIGLFGGTVGIVYALDAGAGCGIADVLAAVFVTDACDACAVR